jgi:hypothetical protein
VWAQNLVPNGSFETYINCPTGNSQLAGNVPPWQNAPGSGTTPDYLNACVTGLTGCNDVGVPNNFAGYAKAFEGNGYAGIISVYTSCTNCREYFQTQLTSPLVANQTYNLSMRVRLGSWCTYAADKMGMYVSTTLPVQPGNQPINFVVPQVVASTVTKDTTQWTLLNAKYVAVGGEQYVTIGCFFDDISLDIDTIPGSLATCILANSAAFYFIDSVIVEPVNIAAAPQAALSSSDTLWCDKTCIDFFDLSQNNPTSWTWYFQGASPSTSTIQNPTGICYSNYGSFDVTLVACNAAGCDSLFLDDFVTEFQLPLPPTITYSNDTLYASPAFAYQWFNTNNVNLVLSTNNYFVPMVDGNYFVLGFDSNGCSTPSATFGFYTSIINVAMNNGLHIFPSPANDVLQLQLKDQIYLSTAQILIYNSLGERVMEITANNFISNLDIDISSFDSGVYYVQLRDNNYNYIRRFQKIKK